MPERTPLVYCFGNHMHWVDMQWLWGYHVLPNCVADMLRYCHETGAKGCVNFDGIGYEKMASEAPEALEALRRAVGDGTVEAVGCSYGQPYGLFHGGESNVRQRVYGVRAVLRLLGVRPRTFWEEEFDFFPQLPQMLRGVGLTGASLYFQWTWHTPEVPFESTPVVLWEGIDGSRLLTATRNRLNLHQWPEDFQILLDELAAVGPAEVLAQGLPSDRVAHAGASELPPLVLQWLELMPSQDWMCRSDLMVPKLKALLADERFDVRFQTLGEYLHEVGAGQLPVHRADASAHHEPQMAEIPVRAYSLDEVWHGMALGKNGDFMRKESTRAERHILEAEALHAVLGLFGRPYANWDVYPVWELEEAWRELLSAQHHDNDECEGLCGHVGKASYRRALALARHQVQAARRHWAARIRTDGESPVWLNPLGWPATVVRQPLPDSGELDRPVPAFGFSRAARPVANGLRPMADAHWVESEACLSLDSGGLKVSLLPATMDGLAHSWTTATRPGPGRHEGEDTFDLGQDAPGNVVKLESAAGAGSLSWRGVPGGTAVGLAVHTPRLDGGLNAALKLRFSFPGSIEVWADHPYGVSRVRTGQAGQKKYPTGDWMTSDQWFESVHGAFTATSFVRVRSGDQEWLLAHFGCRQWFLRENALECVVNAYDPWDEDYFEGDARSEWSIVRCEGFKDSDCFRHAQVPGPVRAAPSQPSAPAGDIGLTDFSFARVSPSNVVASALYREAEDYAGRGLEDYAGRGMGCPYVLRLVEFDGQAAEVDLTLAGPVAAAFKTNLLGETEEVLDVERGDDHALTTEPGHLKPFGIEAARIRFKMRPHEIATLYLDIVPGRKQYRDLDAKREVWATVHRKAD